MDSILYRAGFDGNEKFGLVRKAVTEHRELSHFFVYRNPLDHDSVRSSVLYFVSAKETFSAGCKCHKVIPQKGIQRLEVDQHKIEDKIVASAS